MGDRCVVCGEILARMFEGDEKVDICRGCYLEEAERGFEDER